MAYLLYQATNFVIYAMACPRETLQMNLTETYHRTVLEPNLFWTSDSQLNQPEHSCRQGRNQGGAKGAEVLLSKVLVAPMAVGDKNSLEREAEQNLPEYFSFS